MSIVLCGTLIVLACTEIANLTAPQPSRTVIPTGRVVVSPSDMRGWSFQRSPTNTASCVFCQMVDGPRTPPAGTGSANLSTAAGGFPPSAGTTAAMKLPEYKGTRLDAITQLQYSNYHWAADEAPNNPTKLELVVDFDLNDVVTSDQSTLVYDPQINGGFTVADSQWQAWNARAGKWWGTQSSVSRGGVSVVNPCVVTSPCTWAELLASFPNLGVHSINGAIILEAAPAQSFGTKTNVDGVVVGVGSSVTTFDFELTPHPVVPRYPPDSTPTALFAQLGTVSGPPLLDSAYRKDIVIVAFASTATQAQRQAVIDSIGGEVVGGKPDPMSQDGYYYVRINGGTTAALLSAVSLLQRQALVSFAGLWRLFEPPVDSYRRPTDGAGWTDWKLDPATTNAARDNWALEYVNAPRAWGCSTGSGSVGVAVVDAGVWRIGNTAGNVDTPNSSMLADTASGKLIDHGTRVSSILASVGNDSSGMTGMAWRARLMLRDRNSDASVPNTGRTIASYPSATQHIIAAGMAGAFG